MRCNDRDITDVDHLRDRIVGRVRDVNHHAQTIHLANHVAAMGTDAIRLRGRTTGVRIVLVPVVGRQLCCPQAHSVKIAQDAKISVKIVAALNIEHCRHLVFRSYAHDIIGIQGQLDLVAIFVQLPQSMIDTAQCLLGLKTARVIFLWNKDGEKEGTFAAFTCARKIPLAIELSLTHAATVVKLSVQRMYVAVKDERALVDCACLRRNFWGRLILSNCFLQKISPKSRIHCDRSQCAET